MRGKPITQEAHLQLLYRLTWFASPLDVNREVNNGRGPVDYKVSMGSADKTLVEFKLARNTKLKANLIGQVGIYEVANDTKSSITVILYFTDGEWVRVQKIAKRTGNARRPLRTGEYLEDRIQSQLADMATRPDLIRSFFRHPSVAYISDC